MATHCSVLAWRIPGTGSLVGCRLWGHTELDMIKHVLMQGNGTPLQYFFLENPMDGGAW